MTNQVHGKKFTDEQAYDALKATRGNFSKAAEMCGVRRKTFADRVAQKPVLKELVEEMKQEVFDQAEENFTNAVFAADLGASKLILETVGKERGYAKNIQVSDPDGREQMAGVVDELKGLIARHAK